MSDRNEELDLLESEIARTLVRNLATSVIRDANKNGFGEIRHALERDISRMEKSISAVETRLRGVESEVAVLNAGLKADDSRSASNTQLRVALIGVIGLVLVEVFRALL